MTENGSPPPQTGPKNITEGEIERALRKHAGVFTLAAREVGCARSNIQQRVGRSKHLQEVCEEIEREVGDVCVGVIVSALLAKDRQMARWYAQTKLKHLGFSTRTELTNPDGTPLALAAPANVTINVLYVDPQQQHPVETTATLLPRTRARWSLPA